MSLHALANHMATKGRNGDSMLVHMTPGEVAGLHALALKHGGELTINPDTGLPEASFLKSLLPMLAGAALNFFVPGLGAAVGGAFGVGAAAGTGIAVGGITGLATGSLSRGLMAGLGAYGGAGLAEGLMGAGASTIGAESAAAGLNMTPELTNELMNAGAGESAAAANNALQQQVTDRMAAATPYEKLSSGFDAFKNNPAGMARSLATPALMAASPIMADLMIPTATKMPDISSNANIRQSIYDPYSGTYRRLNPVPAANYGTPAYKPFNEGGIVALAAGGPSAAAPTGLTPQQQQALNLMYQATTTGAPTASFDALGGYAAAKKLAESAGFDATPEWQGSYASTQAAAAPIAVTSSSAATAKTPAEQALELMYQATNTGAPTASFDALGGYAAAKKLAQSAGFDATPEWQQAYEKKMGYTVIPRMSTAQTQAADKAVADKMNADAAAAAAANKVTSGGVVDLLTDTGVKQDKTDTTTTGINKLATTTAGGVTAPKTTTDGTYLGTSGVAPAMSTLFGQGKFVGTGTEAGTGTTGPILDYGGISAFGLTSPMAAAKTQIADQSIAKNLADKNKLDLYSQWGAANPKATNLEHANFVDKIDLDPAVAARLIGISPDQALSAYNDAKYNKMTGDSQAAYNYLMGKGAYPTKSGVGEIMRPYAEATLGMPTNPNRKYIYDKDTGRYNLNPDFVQQVNDPSGGVNYLMSQKEIFDYFKKNANQDDATTYAWAVANNITPKEISEATGVPISQIAPKWRAAAAGAAAKKAVTNADGTVDETKLAAQKEANFDYNAYLKANPDVQAELDSGKANFGTKDDLAAAAWAHYVRYGQAEGRAYTKKAAGGGIMKLAMGGMPMDGYAVGGGLGSLGSYSDGGRLLKGPGDGVSDSIPATIGRKQQPARLADGEFVVPARIVSELGNGSTDAGAKKLYAMMDRVQRARGKTTGKNKVAANSRADKYLPA